MREGRPRTELLTPADEHMIRAELADLYRWRDENAWRTDSDPVYRFQRAVNDQHIARLERMLEVGGVNMVVLHPVLSALACVAIAVAGGCVLFELDLRLRRQ